MFSAASKTNQAGGSDGTVGIFQLGSGNIRNKYTYASDSSTASGVAAASAVSVYGSAAGNATRGIFALGCSASDRVITRNKYTYATCTSTAAASASVKNRLGAGVGNSTIGIFALGQTACACINASNVLNRYTYASDTSTASGVGNLTQKASGASAAGNSTRGIIAGITSVGCNPSSTRNKYTYACSSVVAAASASAMSSEGSATGNATRGIFHLGRVNVGTVCCPNYQQSATRNKYTYACDTSTATGVASASLASVYSSAAGNSTIGIFALGNICGSVTTTRNKYTYATCTSTSAAAASNASQGGAAASWSTGVNS